MITASLKAGRTFNPIRSIVDSLQPPKDHPKPLLNLALGDPTAHGLRPPSVLTDAVKESLERNNANGYLPSTGSAAARRAIAQFSSLPSHEVNEDDVVIASGCSGALELVISALINPGDNLLVPNPGFPLYQVITDSLGGFCRHYPLLPDADWEVDLTVLESLIDSRTKALLINNPSNPCGSTFSAAHLQAITDVAARHGLPIIADEIYSGLVYSGAGFVPAHTCQGQVPVLSLSGIAKEFVVPGWRVGWVVMHDKGTGRLDDVRRGLRSLTQLIVGACSLLQAALPRLLTPAPGSPDALVLQAYMEGYKNLLRTNAQLCRQACQDPECPELACVAPSGAMYAMISVRIDALTGIKDDADFAKQLLVEQNIVLLPGKCFGMDSFVRIITCPPAATLQDAFGRIKEFVRSRRATATAAAAGVGAEEGAAASSSPSKRSRPS